ncbi:endonuclease domain-containing protein [Roseibium marinum]
MRQTPVSPLAGEMPALAGRGGYTASVPHAVFGIQKRACPMPHQKIPQSLRSNARKLRSDMTEAEKKLWQVIGGHRLEGLAFRRQMPIAGYIVDFAAPTHRLIVELDGSRHGEIQGRASDERRDRTLRSLGWTVLRFWNTEVVTDLDGVCRKILDACRKEHF